ncbi:MAG TPA: L-histidine N(alpha)-methyltransferase [Rhodocyclaceae bacterium]|nr:L-histidine N(alpha)-methyltransferase [Rhodocyclaceae bacterium]
MRATSALASSVKASAPDFQAQFFEDVVTGLRRPHKSISSTWLYDEYGSELFEKITQLPEYYLTRVETAILARCVPVLRNAVGSNATLVEIGSGSSRKTPLVLGALDRPRNYVPIDVSAEFLDASVDRLQHDFPGVRFFPMVADFTRAMSLPRAVRYSVNSRKRLGFFPGSTIGNLTPYEAITCLKRLRQLLGSDSLLVVGTDTTRNPTRLIPAYDDVQGVTAEFNLNLLNRINRELAGTFDLRLFRHEARFDPCHGRVEMHLVSTKNQWAEVSGRPFRLQAGESIHTENSYKYSVNDFRVLARSAGWANLNTWTDSESLFAVHLFAPINS